MTESISPDADELDQRQIIKALDASEQVAELLHILAACLVDDPKTSSIATAIEGIEVLAWRASKAIEGLVS